MTASAPGRPGPVLEWLLLRPANSGQNILVWFVVAIGVLLVFFDKPTDIPAWAFWLGPLAFVGATATGFLASPARPARWFEWLPTILGATVFWFIVAAVAPEAAIRSARFTLA